MKQGYGNHGKLMKDREQGDGLNGILVDLARGSLGLAYSMQLISQSFLQ